MKIFTVSLFGHRKINNLRLLDDKLTPIIMDLIKTKEYVSFLIGRNGEFDEYAASIIKQMQKAVGKENNEITLVLPYSSANIDYYEKYYDSVIIPESVYCAHPKAAITLKNRWMIERSDLVLFYVEREEGGAYKAMEYAQKQNKTTINICYQK